MPKRQEWQFALGLLDTLIRAKRSSTLSFIAASVRAKATRVAIRNGLDQLDDQSQSGGRHYPWLRNLCVRKRHEWQFAVGGAQHDDPSQSGRQHYHLLCNQLCESGKSGNSFWGLLSSMIEPKMEVDIIIYRSNQRLRKATGVAIRMWRAQDVDRAKVEVDIITYCSFQCVRKRQEWQFGLIVRSNLCSV